MASPYDIFAEETPTRLPHRRRRTDRAHRHADGAARRRRRAAALDSDDAGGEWVLKSPMAGVVREILVSADDEVAEGQVLVVVEAMKMQNELHARTRRYREGRVRERRPAGRPGHAAAGASLARRRIASLQAISL